VDYGRNCDLIGRNRLGGFKNRSGESRFVNDGKCCGLIGRNYLGGLEVRRRGEASGFVDHGRDDNLVGCNRVRGLDRPKRLENFLGYKKLGGLNDLWRHGNSGIATKRLGCNGGWLVDEKRGNRCLQWNGLHHLDGLGKRNKGRFTGDLILTDYSGIILGKFGGLLNSRGVRGLGARGGWCCLLVTKGWARESERRTPAATLIW